MGYSLDLLERVPAYRHKSEGTHCPLHQRRGTDALGAVLDAPSVEIFVPGEHHWLYLAEAVREADARGNLAFDAAIVSICRENGVTELLTEDRDFDRFASFVTQRL